MAATKPLRVLIVEDDPFTQMTLATVVTFLGHEVVSQTGTVVAALDAARSCRPDVALLDLDLGPGPTGIDAAYGLRGLLPDVGIVLLSSYTESRVMGRRARPLPARAIFVSKQELSNREILDAALRSSVEVGGEAIIGRAAVHLTDSQLELMRLVASGLSNDEIARRLWLEESSVRRSITRLLRKLNIEPSDNRNARVQLTRAYNELAGQTVRGD